MLSDGMPNSGRFLLRCLHIYILSLILELLFHHRLECGLSTRETRSQWKRDQCSDYHSYLRRANAWQDKVIIKSLPHELKPLSSGTSMREQRA